MSVSGIPVQILQDQASEERGESARMSIFVGAIAIGDLLKDTLGPKGMDKILVPMGSAAEDDGANDLAKAMSRMLVTNDGATILRSIHVDNPAAKVLVELSRVQDEQIGDGTTSVCILAAELLRQAEQLIGARMHPQVIVQGYRKAAAVGVEALRKHSQLPIGQDAIRAALLAIARTTLSSKILATGAHSNKEHFARIAVDAVLQVSDFSNDNNDSDTSNEQSDKGALSKMTTFSSAASIDHIQIVKKLGGSLADSYLDSTGLILDKRLGINSPRRLEGHPLRICVANTSMDSDKVKVFGSRFTVDSTGQLADLEAAERQRMRDKVNRIASMGIACFVNRQLIYGWPESLFAEAGVATLEHADFEGVEKLARATGARIISTFDDLSTSTSGSASADDDSSPIGHCGLIEEVVIGDDKLVRFGDLPAGSKACTVVLRAATQQMLDEAERSLHDAFCVLSRMVFATGTSASNTVSDNSSDSSTVGVGGPQDALRVVYGGGSAECLMAAAIDAAALSVTGKEALAMKAFATALRALPCTLADNGGYDSSELLAQLTSLHAQQQQQQPSISSDSNCNNSNDSLLSLTSSSTFATSSSSSSSSSSNATEQEVVSTYTHYGIDMNHGRVADMQVAGIVESLRLKTTVVSAAAEAAEMIVRVDDIIRCAPRPRSSHRH